MKQRVVFDTTTVVSALLFAKGRLAWLRAHWSEARCVPLISRDTSLELTRVLKYPKFKLSTSEQQELLSDYLPYCEIVDVSEPCLIPCRDAKDQPFLDLAHAGRADILVSGDGDLLVLQGQTNFLIESPSVFAQRHGHLESA